MKLLIKNTLNIVCKILVLPLALPTRLEQWLLPSHAETVFGFCAQLVALLPGAPGMFMRRAFYCLTLDQCSDHCYIGFGTIFSHRQAIIKDHVYIGKYALIGSAHIEENSLIGSRTSIISGTGLHTLDPDGTWSSYSHEQLEMIKIERNVWVGEGAIIIANVAEGCMISAGAVVTNQTKPRVLMAGNPARFVKKLVQSDEAE
ncbi:MAG: acyltransferase [Cellvibrionaceae bacterium]|nr:acyltransferase [Cellvibrionaceae bacterium]